MRVLHDPQPACSSRLAPFGDVLLVDADLSVALGCRLDPVTRSVVVATVPLVTD